MKMLRHYFVSNDLDDLEHFEEELEAGGVPTPQIHVLSLNDTDVENHHHLHEVFALMKRDIIHSTVIGAIIGALAAVLVLVIANLAGWTDTAAGSMPFVFLAIVVLGFCTWEGGLFGIQTLNHHFTKFEDTLNAGKHVFFVDLEPEQEPVLARVVKDHPHAEMAGTGAAAPHWIAVWQRRLTHFLGDTLP